MKRKNIRYLIGVGLTGATTMLWALSSNAQTFSPYSDFQAMTLAQLTTLQVKLTYVGAQDRTQPSLAFTSPSNTLNLSAFIPFRRPAISYANDDAMVRIGRAHV